MPNSLNYGRKVKAPAPLEGSDVFGGLEDLKTRTKSKGNDNLDLTDVKGDYGSGMSGSYWLPWYPKYEDVRQVRGFHLGGNRQTENDKNSSQAFSRGSMKKLLRPLDMLKAAKADSMAKGSVDLWYVLRTTDQQTTELAIILERNTPFCKPLLLLY